ncbi:hypothetical protein COCCADRAFT_89604 [Bipolaris zeicola 26-R-13]|uniref:Uncharacterized protein n=1 Tax=Cochliobolus carbonum (strain 26-R-13) TaxID=930089 RepID=W6YE44_COCC2|nr:uncharacterized protein COCCADRAFT_89604 [Bipolaris zeicola 26-R-13]EUC35938.1 hypothetical protein COCCADRAFT_89604 [Bipolaris zeicola 26-R-13]
MPSKALGCAQEGWMLGFPLSYLEVLKQNCEKIGRPLIIDEAQNVLGKAGDFFSFTHHTEDGGVVPDTLTLSKTMGNGLPLSYVLTSNKIARHAEENGFLLYNTHINYPCPAAVNDNVFGKVFREDLCVRCKRLGVKLPAGLKKFQSRYGCIGDNLDRGLTTGVEIVSDGNTKAGQKMEKMGLWAQLATMASLGGVFRIAHPITVMEEELHVALGIIEEALRMTPGTMPLYVIDEAAIDGQPIVKSNI